MSWPLASHFSAMLQNPKIAFRDPELQGAAIEKDGRNQPRPWAGAFAVVYKATMTQNGKAMAVRVFTSESPERRERYDRISEYLRSRRLKCLLDFEYRDRSIRSAGDGKWYPLIVMDWVDGETLFQWVRRRSLAGDRQSLAEAAERWVGLVKELGDAGIAHGDLQHANVMVTRAGELKLVDYDCMCVPALVGRRNLEVGVEPYQHPDRNETTHLGPDLDNFAALVIYVALRALAAEPALWGKYVEGPAYDKLLFRREDFSAPASSSLHRDLGNSPDEELRELAKQLFALWNARMDQAPALAELTNSYAKVERLLRAGQWEAAVHLLNRRGQFRDAPPHLKPLIHQAYEHVCRQQSWSSFEKIPLEESEENDRRLAEAWNEPLFAGYEPAERLRGQVEAARHRVSLLDRLRLLIQQAAKGSNFAKEWSIVAAARQLPEDYRYGLHERVALARRRVEAIEALERAVRQSRNDDEIVAAWRAVSRSQSEGMVDPKHRRRIELAARRLPVLTALRAIPEGCPPDQVDGRLLAVWRDDVVDGCRELAAWRPAWLEAARRRQLLRQIEEAIGRRDEEAIARLVGDPLLENYPLPSHWDAPVRAAKEQARKTDTLIEALGSGDRASFARSFDARIIRRAADRFAAYEPPLCDWVRAEILPVDAIGLRPAVARASLVAVDRGEGTFRVRWTWPQQRFTNECILAVCPEIPAAEDDPRDAAAHYRAAADRESWESGGGSRLIHVEPGWQADYVVVWASVDLGFRLLFSHPLVLGRLNEAADMHSGGRKRRF